MSLTMAEVLRALRVSVSANQPKGPQDRRTKETRTSRRLYNGLRGRRVAINRDYVGIRCKKGQAPSTTCPGEVKRSMRAYVSIVPTRAVPAAAPRWQAAEGEVAPQPQPLLLLRPCPSAGRRARGVCGRCARLGGRALLTWGALP